MDETNNISTWCKASDTPYWTEGGTDITSGNVFFLTELKNQKHGEDYLTAFLH